MRVATRVPNGVHESHGARDDITHTVQLTRAMGSVSSNAGWIEDDEAALMDVDTENDSVVKAYYDWVGLFV